jgi:pimeloyl-ACP methyl ester carboxylesterase
MGDRARASAPVFHTHRVIEGDGPCVVLIHGVGLDHRMWSGQAAALSERFTVLRYDLIGHGSTPPWTRRLELTDFVAQLAALLDEERIRRIHVVGFSLGALIAQAFALAHPRRLMRLVLVSGVHQRNDPARQAVLDRLEQAEREGPSSLCDAAIDRWFSHGYRNAHRQEVSMIEERLRMNTPRGFLPAYRLFARADGELAGRLGEIKAPVLVITGADDIGSTPEMARRMSKAVGNAECRIVPGARHMLPMEAAEEVNKMLSAFLLTTE